ncbi:30S ribosome-binding factor RbfA [Thalassoroseus pseudoceratinae]|uniref:30S ribosome-binding factor RbfA n=1 Tax=Thalassoroseus pseudoceratinae TaxID=2713176 RepID=UPI001421B4B3|nr:30S ribosome-binding factor RbfA [Thalassoroseus pseudoceratinae]
MQSRRQAKIARAIQEQVSTSVLFELRDPRVKNVTVLHAEVAPDNKSAKVYVSIMGDEKEQALCLHGLESARGYLQGRIADRIETRWTPILTFVNDPGIKKSVETAKHLRELLAETEDSTSTPDEESTTDQPSD